MINYLDLFSGCGGFRLALEQAGVHLSQEYHSDIDKYANKIYAKHFKNSENLGDVRTIIPHNGLLNGTKINLITFGFPCQDLSIAGRQSGLAGSQSGLFFQATRLIRELRPEVFIFENVKGLLTNNKGQDFIRCLQEIADIGFYDCQWQLLNTRWFLPQNRERIYFVGLARGYPRRQIFPITETDFIDTKQSKEAKKGDVSPCLTARSNKARLNIDAVYIKSIITPKRYANKRQNGIGIADICPTLTTQDRHGVMLNNHIRELTPMECERLQGFPDNWTAGISSCQRYKMLGNAVSVPVIREVIRRCFL